MPSTCFYVQTFNNAIIGKTKHLWLLRSKIKNYEVLVKYYI